MADNVIKVSVTSTKSQRVSVSSSQQATNITASPDTGRFWSQTSKNWAVSENIVDGEDYSSKYYANKSKENSNTAKSYLETTQETYSNFVTSANGYISELTDLKDAGAVEINEAVASGKDEINSTKTTILNDIEFVADGEKEEIQELADQAKDDIKSTGFYMRDDKLYFINSVGEEEEFKTNDNELNNPFSLLDYKYSEYELNNLSWLRSQGQYNSKAIYPAVYDLLLKIYNGVETKDGVSVKLATETFTDYDFVLNTADETFRLPVKVKLASGKAVFGNGMSLGMTDGTANFGFQNTSNGVVWFGSNSYDVPLGSVSPANTGTNKGGIGVTTDPTKSGLELSDSDLYLYFYVGETVQNANLINAGRIEETLVKKVDMQQATIASFPSNKYIDLTLGASGTTYTAPANGWYYINGNNPNTFVDFSFKVDGVTIRGDRVAGNSSAAPIGLVATRKGEKVTITYTIPYASAFRFIYAEGEQ